MISEVATESRGALFGASSVDLQREILLAMRRAVGAPMAFCFTDAADRRGALRGLQSVGDKFMELPSQHLADLAQAFRFPTFQASAPRRHSVDATELFGPSSLRPVSASFHFPISSPNGLLVFLHYGDALLGIAGVWRGPEDEPFDDEAMARLEQIGPLLSSFALLHGQYQDARRRELLIQAIPGFSGTYCVVDVSDGRLVHTCNTVDDDITEGDIFAHEADLVAAAESALGEMDRNGTAATARTLDFASIARIVDLGPEPLFGGGRCVILALQSSPDSSQMDLSEREGQIARLLADGFSCLNAAALLNLSQNTVRTYVRRIYKKLDVTNRADLARKVAPLMAVAAAAR